VSKKDDFSGEVSSASEAISEQEEQEQMYRIYCNKLVRDKIPDIIKANGRSIGLSTRSGGQLIVALKKKLVEECHEMQDTNHKNGFKNEAGDFLEAMCTLLNQYGISLKDLSSFNDDDFASSRINLLRLAVDLLKSHDYKNSKKCLAKLYYSFLLLLQRKNINLCGIAAAMERKKRKNGSFSRGFFLQYFDIPEGHPKCQMYLEKKGYRAEPLPQTPSN
jgi:predicted house-cleaning noncanonical NTP pyrophosphatase (MazG superfamily)